MEPYTHTNITPPKQKLLKFSKIKMKQDQHSYIDKHILECICKNHKLGEISANNNNEEGKEKK